MDNLIKLKQCLDKLNKNNQKKKQNFIFLKQTCFSSMIPYDQGKLSWTT